jgi:Tfp pilus assembly protein PilX
MKKTRQNYGSALLVAIFAVALLATIVAGILQLTTEQAQLMANQVYATEAFEIAEAGLNDAMAQIRSNSSWNTGFSAKSFAGGNYSVDVNNINSPSLVITSWGTNAQGYVAKITAHATVGYAAPYPIRIDMLKVNR